MNVCKFREFCSWRKDVALLILIGSYHRIQKGYIFFVYAFDVYQTGALMYVKLYFWCMSNWLLMYVKWTSILLCVRTQQNWFTSKINRERVRNAMKLLVVYANNRNFASSKQGNREATSIDNTSRRYRKFERFKVNRLSGYNSKRR